MQFFGGGKWFLRKKHVVLIDHRTNCCCARWWHAHLFYLSIYVLFFPPLHIAPFPSPPFLYFPLFGSNNVVAFKTFILQKQRGKFREAEGLHHYIGRVFRFFLLRILSKCVRIIYCKVVVTYEPITECFCLVRCIIRRICVSRFGRRW